MKRVSNKQHGKPPKPSRTQPGRISRASTRTTTSHENDNSEEELTSSRGPVRNSRPSTQASNQTRITTSRVDDDSEEELTSSRGPLQSSSKYNNNLRFNKSNHLYLQVFL